jgi:sortase A
LKRRLSILLLVVLLLTGGGYFSYQGLKIEIKAKVAQVLLQRAWHQTLKTGQNYRPWPSFDGVPIMRLVIPQHNINQIVLKGTSGQALAFGPAFHEESFLPQEKKITIISSHRDSHGIFIKKLQLGEEIKIQDADNHWHTYTIDSVFVINVQKEKIAMDRNENRLLLITCYPFDAIRSGTPLRYIVSAKKYTI